MNYTQTKKHTFADLVKRKRAYWKKRRYGSRYIRRDVKVGSIVEGCDLHVGHVTYVNPYNGDVTIKSFFTGKEGNCDLYHCGVVVQNAKKLKQKLELYRTGGMDAIGQLWDKRVRKGTY